jgi:hypothetical protein
MFNALLCVMCVNFYPHYSHACVHYARALSDGLPDVWDEKEKGGWEKRGETIRM